MQPRVFKGKAFYHIQNSGVERRVIFSSKEDFDRFEAYLYLLNAVESPRAANFFSGGRESQIFESGRGENLVAIGAYSIVPQHFHLIVTPLSDGGVGKFMQKVQTAYTMYFNKKYARQGRIFHSAYRSRELLSDDELKSAYAYVHLQPASIFDQTWEDATGTELAVHVSRAMEYRYSSAGEYLSSKFVITSPARYPQYIRRAKDAQTHFAFWIKHRNVIT